MNRDQLLEEVEWMAKCLEALTINSIIDLEKFVYRNIPSAELKCRDWQDWERFGIGHFQGWEKQLLVDASSQAKVLNKMSYYKTQIYVTQEEAHYVSNTI